MRNLTVLILLPLALLAAPRPPNFVVIFIDDLGYGDIGPYGATKQRTPNLDRMAAEGMKLTSFYAAPVCSVSRAQLMTGCYGARVSVPGVYFPGGPQGLHPSENTVADLLRPLGYATACVGKWHLGDQPDFLPTRQGFDRYLGIPYSNDMQRAAKGSKTRVSPLVRDDKVAELLTDEQQSSLVARYTDEALRFMRESKDRPFFLYFPHTAVHTPIWPGEAFRGKSRNGRFGDWVEEVDWSVGKVLETLKELGLDENTLVLFTSDNGPWMIKGADGGSAGPLRGSKGSTWEGGVRVPTVVRWPGRIPAGTARSAVAGTIDVLPTLVGLAGGKVPAEPVIDGRDIAPLLTGRTEASAREAHYYFAGYNLQAVRQGRWKLALAPQPAGHGKAKNEGTVSKVPRLYDLEADIGETTDLAEREPAVVEKLRSLAERISAEIGGNTPQARRGPGVVASPRLLYEVQEDPKPALAALKNGDRLESKDAPQIAGRRIRIETVFSTKQKDAVIVSHGGSSIGYALHLQAGRLRFSVRNGEEAFVEAPTAGGEVKAVATLEKDGTLTLAVGDAPAVVVKGPKAFTRQPQEDFCVGHDAALAAVPYAGEPVKFKGRLGVLRVTAD